jgi:hypothetical protein
MRLGEQKAVSIFTAPVIAVRVSNASLVRGREDLNVFFKTNAGPNLKKRDFYIPSETFHILAGNF